MNARTKTQEDLFHTVAMHLLAQGKPAMDDDNCCYRADDGSMCAIGCLVADEHYSRDLEGATICVAGAGIEAAVVASIGRPLAPSEFQMLASLQEVHDDFITGPQAWPERLRLCATEYGLAVRPELKAAMAAYVPANTTACA